MLKNFFKLGLIGTSPGNGHPFSWSAIFNGFDHTLIDDCGFTAIPNYLKKKKYPDDFINSAQVTHIWTQDRKMSEKIAKTCFIENIVDKYTDMIGKVDGILLARDDANFHYELSKPFLLEGLPIYIDKPLALTKSDALRILKLQQYEGQVFSCSALKYAEEFTLTNSEKEEIGEILSIDGYVPKDWERYSVHIIEPILNLIPNRGRILDYEKIYNLDRTKLVLNFENVRVSLNAMGSKNIKTNIKLTGKLGSKNLVFHNTFDAFKKALLAFVKTINHKEKNYDCNNLLDIIKIIELGI